MLAEKCRELHDTQRAAITASGMAALAAGRAVAARTTRPCRGEQSTVWPHAELLTSEAARLGIGSTLVDACDLTAVEKAFQPRTKLLVVETISNPLLRVADLQSLGKLAHAHGAAPLADNTLAGPAVCRPREWRRLGHREHHQVDERSQRHGAGTAVRTGRSLAARARRAIDLGPGQRVRSTAGWRCAACRPWPCASNAPVPTPWKRPSSWARPTRSRRVYYPGLSEHPDHAMAVRQFGHRFGSMVAFTLRGGGEAVQAFMAASPGIPFCPSLGELNTTLSHPASTSHRSLSPDARAALGITDGTIRLSVGIESTSWVLEALAQGVHAVRV